MMKFFAKPVNLYDEITQQVVDVEKIKHLLTSDNTKKQLNCHNKNGDTPLCAAVRMRNLVLVKTLIVAGADVTLARININSNELVGENNHTPLHDAVMPNINKLTDSALHESCLIIQSLVNSGANLNAPNITSDVCDYLCSIQLSNPPRATNFQNTILSLLLEHPLFDLNNAEKIIKEKIENARLKLTNSQAYCSALQESIRAYEHRTRRTNTIDSICEKIKQARLGHDPDIMDTIYQRRKLSLTIERQRIDQTNSKITLLEEIKNMINIRQKNATKESMLTMLTIVSNLSADNYNKFFTPHSTLKNDFLENYIAEPKLIPRIVSKYL